MRKKVFAALLAVCMVVAMLPVSAFAVDEPAEFAVSAYTTADETWAKKKLSTLSNDITVSAKDADNTWHVTGMVNYTVWEAFNGNPEDVNEQDGWYLPLHHVIPVGTEVYLKSNNGTWPAEDDADHNLTAESYKVLSDGSKAVNDDIVWHVADRDGKINNIEFLTITGEEGSKVYTTYTVDLQGLKLGTVEKVWGTIVDDKVGWQDLIDNHSPAFDPEKTANWNNTTITTYPAIALEYTRNLAGDPIYLYITKAGALGKSWTYRMTVDNYVNGVAHFMAQLSADMGLDENSWEGTYEVTPVVAKGTVSEAAGTGLCTVTGEWIPVADSLTLTYSKNIPSAGIAVAEGTDKVGSKTAADLMDAETPVTAVVEGTKVTLTGKAKYVSIGSEAEDVGYFVALKVSDLDNGKELVSAKLDAGTEADLVNGSAVVYAKLRDAAAENTFTLKVQYGYQQEGSDAALANRELTYTVDATKVEMPRATDLETTADSTVTPDKDGNAIVNSTDLLDDIAQAKRNAETAANAGAGATTSVTSVTLNVGEATDVHMDEDTLGVLADEAVESIVVNTSVADVTLPSEVLGEEYQTEGKLQITVKDVPAADAKALLKEDSTVDAADIKKAVNVSIPTAANGVQGLEETPITITMTVTDAETNGYQLAYIDEETGEICRIKDSKAKENILTGTTTHLTTFVAVASNKISNNTYIQTIGDEAAGNSGFPESTVTVTGTSGQKVTLIYMSVFESGARAIAVASGTISAEGTVDITVPCAPNAVRVELMLTNGKNIMTDSTAMLDEGIITR